MLAASWLKESSPVFFSNSDELVRSLNGTFRRSLMSLFWAIWTDLMLPLFGSVSSVLTFVHSWSPYFNLDIQSAWASCKSFVCGMWFDTLLMANSLLLRQFIRPFLPKKCSFQLWFSSIVIPSSFVDFSCVIVLLPTLI